jgi:hypothetical protein
MKKKNRFKSWLAGKLRKWANKLEPELTYKVEHINVPIVTLCANVKMPMDKPISEDRINEILAHELSKDIIQYAKVEWCDNYYNSWVPERDYRAILRVAPYMGDKYEDEKDYRYNAKGCGKYTPGF